MLIKCPECGKEISDRAAQCIHCGCPLSEHTVQPTTSPSLYAIVVNKYHTYGAPRMTIANALARYNRSEPSQIAQALVMLPAVLIRDLPYSDCMRIQDALSRNNIDASVTPVVKLQTTRELPNARAGLPDNPDVIRCPRCGSTAITTGQRGFKLTTGFIGSSQTENRCAKCGYKWKPSKWS